MKIFDNANRAYRPSAWAVESHKAKKAELLNTRLMTAKVVGLPDGSLGVETVLGFSKLILDSGEPNHDLRKGRKIFIRYRTDLDLAYPVSFDLIEKLYKEYLENQ